MNHFTVLGAGGFVGSHLVNYLKKHQMNYTAPGRDDLSIYSRHLGHVIYCIGLTADFRERPFDTVEAHVCLLKEILSECSFDSFLYLSSTRIYSGQKRTCEQADLVVNPLNPSDLYNISKLMGESICFSKQSPTVRVARISNVIGNDFNSNNFINSLIKDAVEKKYILLNTTMESEKDYIDIQDVVKLLPEISIGGKHRIYNVASGINTTNVFIINKIKQVTGCLVEVAHDPVTRIDISIDIQRLQNEFLYSPTNLDNTIETLTNSYISKVRGLIT
ncbi:NAD-dependent epimerase/dehydratase family protein [Paenibacillus sp. LMG 31461]|uniref:NAD-dependent epimerase/dehydratase family protein n=1 Tax=Paenibacillus plantarum TaxID=2654975 RepID=A0ABX1XE30_9BACL|nr:SDR family oxidoreductase [Paenibacillus plantarum]NOU66742.1 NAD-dependent epimerase/dehydratase family protein [Paenibacillus plantarum]